MKCCCVNDMLPHHAIVGLPPSPNWMDPMLNNCTPSDSFKCSVISISSRFGDRAFAAAGPWLWNSLPAHNPSACLNSGQFLLEIENVLLSSRHQRLVTVCFLGAGYIFLLTYISIDAPQPGGTQAPPKSTSVSWWWINERMTRRWPCLESTPAVSLKKQSRLSWMREETGGQLVVSLPVALVKCLVHRIRRTTIWINHVSKAFSPAT